MSKREIDKTLFKTSSAKQKETILLYRQLIQTYFSYKKSHSDTELKWSNKNWHTTNLEWRFKLKKDGLAKEDFSRFQAQPPDLRLCQLNIFPWSWAADCNRSSKLLQFKF